MLNSGGGVITYTYVWLSRARAATRFHSITQYST